MYSRIYFVARNVINGPGQFEESNSALPNMSSVLHCVSVFLSLASASKQYWIITHTAARMPKPGNPAAEHGEISGLDSQEL